MTPQSTNRQLARALVDALRDAGSTHVFGVPGGGSNLDVVGAATEAGMQFVLTHTETAAAVMAGVVGELTGSPGVCVATRGPGAASAVNGVAQALLDRQPMVLVTDCVTHADHARVSHQRLDQHALMATVTKRSVQLSEPSVAAEAVQCSTAGRPGPVHIDIDASAPGSRLACGPGAATHTADDADWQRIIGGANRPVLVVGVGAVVLPPEQRELVARLLAEIGERTGVPVLCTYKARGMVADSAPWCAGIVTGATIESPLLAQADLVLGVGLDPVELIPAPWPYEAPVVLLGRWAVDDSTWFEARLAAEVLGDLATLLAEAAGLLRSEWPDGTPAIHRRRARGEILAAEPATPSAIVPQHIVTITRELAPADAIATVDAGAHMLVAMPLWTVEQPCRLLISSGLATMGFALPAAIAAAEVNPGTRVICFTGDGGLGMALAELETLARRWLDVVVVVFNDSLLSLIAAKQAPQGHGGSAAVQYLRTDFAATATGLGVHGTRVDDIGCFRSEMTAALERSGPTLIDAVVDPSAYSDVLDAIRGPRRKA